MSDAAWQIARAVAETQHWLLTAPQARAAGLTPSEVRTAGRRGAGACLVAGVYLLDGDLFDNVPDHLWWRAALLAHGARACLVGWTGARAIGAQGLPGSDPTVDVAIVDGGSRHHRSLGPRACRLSDGR